MIHLKKGVQSLYNKKYKTSLRDILRALKRDVSCFWIVKISILSILICSLMQSKSICQRPYILQRLTV